MPPRYAYWTIMAGGLPTAFRAAEQEELVPTFNRLKQKHPDAEMKYFARGRLWSSREEAQRDAETRRTASRRFETPRGRDWRPGGEHRDPRQPFKDAKKERNQRWRKERFEKRERFGKEKAAGESPRDRRPFGDRPRGEHRGDRGPFSDRPRGEHRDDRQPFADGRRAEQRGDRQSFGDRRPRGAPHARKQFGDRRPERKPWASKPPRKDASFAGKPGDRKPFGKPRDRKPFSGPPRDRRGFGGPPREGKPFGGPPRHGRRPDRKPFAGASGEDDSRRRHRSDEPERDRPSDGRKPFAGPKRPFRPAGRPPRDKRRQP